MSEKPQGLEPLVIVDNFGQKFFGVSQAEQLMPGNPDSALTILEAIDPSEIKVDSLKAKFHYLRAFGHMKSNRSMIGDSLISFAHNYYRGKDIVKDLRSGLVLAWYKFWVGDTPGSIAMLDSLAGLHDVPDSLMAQTLRIRVTLEAIDLFNTSCNDAVMFNDAVKLAQKNYSSGRSVMLTLQYRFNTTRDRYRGTGAGNFEKSRF